MIDLHARAISDSRKILNNEIGTGGFAVELTFTASVFSAGLGTGVAGLFHQKFTADAPHSTGWGRYTGVTWGGDLAWSFRSRISLGIQIHLLDIT